MNTDNNKGNSSSSRQGVQSHMRLVGQSAPMKFLRRRISQIGRKILKKFPPYPSVLITGETGTGKELVAQALYKTMQVTGRFVSVNCAAIPPELIENELFGHDKGAFTSAQQIGLGKFELAQNGVLFLDEIGELPLSLQPRLLRVLGEGEFTRIGGTKVHASTAWVIAATNKDLLKMVNQGKFRDDLYYRLEALRVRTPPLRERREDIEEILNHYKQVHELQATFTEEALDTVLTYPWPGNIRQLVNTVIRLAMLFEDDAVIDVDDLDLPLNGHSHELDFASENLLSMPTLPAGGTSLSEYCHKAEISLVCQALLRTDGNKVQAAKLLNIERPRLYYILDRTRKSAVRKES